MKRLCFCLMLAVTAQPAWAAGDAPYYGPMKRWHGIGYKFGYEDRIEKDGSWRIETAIHGRGEAIDMALYRAAERARDAGYRYVFLLGGKGYTSPGISGATLYARPSNDAIAPTGCRSRKPTACYTADVAEVLRILGGPDGTQPGVAIMDHRDEYGREVFLSGYGTGGIASTRPGGVTGGGIQTIIDGRVAIRSTGAAPAARPMAPASIVATGARVAVVPLRPAYVPIGGSTRDSGMPTADERLQQALKAARPIRGHNAKQGWTISD